MAQRLFTLAALAAGLLSLGCAHAQGAGSLIVRVGATEISPDTKSGNLSSPSFAGTRALVGANMQPTGGVTWMWTGNLSLDLPLAAGFKHDITGDGAIAGVGKIGEVKALPATLLVQYRFGSPDAAVRPYVGAGPTYAKFYGGRGTMALTGLTGGTPANPTGLSVQSKWTASGQVGLAWRLSTQWSIDTSMTYTPLKTRTTLSTGQTLDATLDPTSVSVGLGYRF
jgi:outer membrane protein